MIQPISETDKAALFNFIIEFPKGNKKVQKWVPKSQMINGLPNKWITLSTLNRFVKPDDHVPLSYHWEDALGQHVKIAYDQFERFSFYKLLKKAVELKIEGISTRMPRSELIEKIKLAEASI